jgi:hypothetical protein
VPAAVAHALRPLLKQVEALTEEIHARDEGIEQIAGPDTDL